MLLTDIDIAPHFRCAQLVVSVLFAVVHVTASTSVFPNKIRAKVPRCLVTQLVASCDLVLCGMWLWSDIGNSLLFHFLTIRNVGNPNRRIFWESDTSSLPWLQLNRTKSFSQNNNVSFIWTHCFCCCAFKGYKTTPVHGSSLFRAVYLCRPDRNREFVIGLPQ